MSKKGGLELSVNTIVFFVLAIAVLVLGISFIKVMFGKSTVKFEELVTNEPEPPASTANSPISLSRETISTVSGSTEAVKISVFNPTNQNWTFRDAIGEEDDLCGKPGDKICYVDTGSTLGNICNNDVNAISTDTDCRDLDLTYDGNNHLDETECNDEGGVLTDLPEGICFIHSDNSICGEKHIILFTFNLQPKYKDA